MEKTTIKLSNGTSADVYRCHTIIVGSGAAGLNCAERLFNNGVKDVLILTTNMYGGTSYCSGSDKQTYYKMSNFGDTTDSPVDMAHSLFNGGCMHGDIAYIESLQSLPAFYHLVENGVPFPHNAYGAFVGYKTDHDPRQRATSAGPKTSKFMVEKALIKVKERNIPIMDGYTVVKIVTANGKACGLVAINENEVEKDTLGVTLFQADNIVLATGGPGELYEGNVYPQGQVSLHGVALEAGASAVNLSESQFGMGSTKFRWNLSGTYQQVIPDFFSEGPDGKRKNFLVDYFRNLPEMATNIFLKGYQWPFMAHRAKEFGSSLVDIAVAIEKREGKRVFMDFMANPTYHGDTLDIQKLEPEARDYLNKSNALQATPYERLDWMNPDSIDIYREHDIDLHDPLEIDVCFQHNNGGLAVDGFYRTEVDNLFAIGEVAGAHGVARPGGSALNSGQVGGIRAAMYIATKNSKPSGADCTSVLADAGQSILDISKRMLESSNDQAAVRYTIQHRMTEAAGFLREAGAVRQALQDAVAMKDTIPGASRDDLVRAWETKNLLTTHIAFLKTIDAYLSSGGGSRGSYLVMSNDPSDPSTVQVDSVKGPLFGFKQERPEDRNVRIKVLGPDMKVAEEPVRPIPEDDSWFENTWTAYRQGKLF